MSLMVFSLINILHYTELDYNFEIETPFNECKYLKTIEYLLKFHCNTFDCGKLKPYFK